MHWKKVRYSPSYGDYPDIKPIPNKCRWRVVPAERGEELWSKHSWQASFEFHLNIYLLQKIKSPDFTSLIQPFSIKVKGQETTHDFLKIWETFDSLIDFNENIKAIIDYPFNQEIEVEIPPPYNWGDEHNFRSDTYSPGYIVWQLSKVIGELYRDEPKEVSVFGTAIDSLLLNGLHVSTGNLVAITMDS